MGVSILLIGGVLLIGRFSYAKYQTIKSFKIVEGTINYKYNPADFEIIALYKQKEESSCTEDSCYEEIAGRMPSSGYVINEIKSYCMIDNTKDTQAVLKTINENHIISNLIKNDKCYIYFDNKVSAEDTILANTTVKTDSVDYSKTSCSSGCGEATVGLYKTTDDDGISYYYRGDVTNNYVNFANKWWRIIRINGDGTIRMIYDGESARENGATLTLETSAFNSTTKNNMYVGFKYTSGQAQGTEIKSTILGALEKWYNNNLASYASNLEPNAGFCGDRRRSTTSGGQPNGTGGTGTTNTYYGAWYRLYSNKKPDLSCENADLYTVNDASKGNKSLDKPIGLITADEVSIAGGVYDAENRKYYLRTNQYYWTMSPSHYNSGNTDPAGVLQIIYDGSLRFASSNTKCGVYPVINLKANTRFIFTGSGEKGSMTNPYVVQ